jgi:hypothetical protein
MFGASTGEEQTERDTENLRGALHHSWTPESSYDVSRSLSGPPPRWQRAC